MSTSNNNFDIPKGGYVAFDAMSLRQLIIQRLNEQNVFTDQAFIGSNLASIIDIIAYSYHTLIYYLNRTSNEAMFTEAALYENINRIVKTIDYKPIGFQTSTLTYNCSALNFSQGIYTIPRYSFIVINNIAFSYNDDITFAKTTNTALEELTQLTQQTLLFQGQFQEYPLYTAAGDNNELLILDTANNLVDHFNINVYVKPVQTGVWKQYTVTPNLYLEDGYSEKYEIRLNSNKRYEIKFGNDINGKKLQTGDQVAVYYLASNGTEGEIGTNVLQTGSSLLLYDTPQFTQILNDINQDNYRYVAKNETINFLFANSSSSTLSQVAETPDQIRNSAPANYRSQYRLVTTPDYELFVKTNFANIITDVKAVNNWDYVSGYLKYFYDIGLDNPTSTSRALFNQVQYSDSCNFNNVYLVLVPKVSTLTSIDYLLPAQKELINSSIQSVKMATTETTFIDPVYKAVSFGISVNPDNSFTPEESISCQLLINKKVNSRRDNQSIINDVANIFTTYFSKKEMKLGQTIDLRYLNQQILAVDGVDYFSTVRINNPDIKVNGLSLFTWNPLYPDNDKNVTQNNITSKFFEYYYYNNVLNIQNNISVTTTPNTYSTVEY